MLSETINKTERYIDQVSGQPLLQRMDNILYYYHLLQKRKLSKMQRLSETPTIVRGRSAPIIMERVSVRFVLQRPKTIIEHYFKVEFLDVSD